MCHTCKQMDRLQWCWQTDSVTSRALFYNEFSTIVVRVLHLEDPKESLSRIRYNSPKLFAQNRVVAASDSKCYFKSFSGFRLPIVMVGDANPPQFGKVFITLKPNSGSTITTSLKNSIQTFCSPNVSVGVSPEVVDAIQLYFRYNANVVYDPQNNFK